MSNPRVATSFHYSMAGYPPGDGTRGTPRSIICAAVWTTARCQISESLSVAPRQSLTAETRPTL
ncbi:hypothetical protein GGTG_10005 [Gaeumannomyces tritici R3-111a-1]|uniref:Uncharacterized protein n=1 Tax=Gaeumannomyces tritici (strain R3-111a-1) TaxID=644352 RepID=J3P921_GAET3|nr:hypothetical protein GGTG_10005 [Gaeumannomyces tritici R3-111a-1]EJT73156.1 hypothetical protein GGTG_10005 [Gaeumannomyces tritici R3-111a-1]